MAQISRAQRVQTALLALINHTYFDFDELTSADYDALGRLAEEVATNISLAKLRTGLLELENPNEETIALTKRILKAKAQAQTDDEFRTQLWGVANSAARTAEDKLKSAVETTNARLDFDAQKAFLNSRISGRAKEVIKNGIVYKRSLQGETSCEWCSKLAGTWYDHTATNGVSLFVRHKGFDCKFEIIKAGSATDVPDAWEMTPAEWQEQNLEQQGEQGGDNGD